MSSLDFQGILEGMIEELASIEHERWSHWQSYMHGKCLTQLDGSMTIPADLAIQWTRQMETAYFDLSSKEKESDREQVRKYIPLIVERLNSSSPKKTTVIVGHSDG